ncbi:MAG: hypothetical protein KY445_11055 [Armatimonadetes bacterium]|nr:hypothetical protein [Armatimonadota bacterium]
MQFHIRSTRTIAVLTATVLAGGALLHPTPARADADKAKTYKYGAIALGAVAAYMAAKGKTVPAAVAAAGGYYAYKKGQDAKNNDRYGYYPDNAVYPDDDGYRTDYRAAASVKNRGAKYDLRPYVR